MDKPEVRDPGPETSQRAAEVLRDGGIVFCPSDANYGIAVDPYNPGAVAACFEIKKRAGTKPLTLFIADPADWEKYGKVRNVELMRRLQEAYWPGPLNVVIDKTEGAPNLSLTEDSTISIACHANPVLRDMVRAAGGVVAMTSANLSGQADDMLVDLDTAIAHLGASVQLAIRGGPITATKSTTILRVTDDIELLREGDLTLEAIRSETMA